MPIHPVTHKDGPMRGRPDSRYTITLEYCGHAKPHYVARFCDEFIGSSAFKSAAIMLACGHDARRRGALVVEGIPA